MSNHIRHTFVHTGTLDAQVGDDVMLVERVHGSNYSVWSVAPNHPDGIGGNTDPAIRRFHGWRGTSNHNGRDIAVYAHGLRKITKIERMTEADNGELQFKISVGPDLHPDWE